MNFLKILEVLFVCLFIIPDNRFGQIQNNVSKTIKGGKGAWLTLYFSFSLDNFWEVGGFFLFEIWQKTNFGEGNARCVFVPQKLLCLPAGAFHLR